MQTGGWYDDLLAPVRSTVESALRDVGEVWGDDLWAVPRTGLGGAVALHVARGFGTDGSRKSRRLCVASIEAWNQRVHRKHVPVERALAKDTRDFLGAWSRFVRRDDARAHRVIERLVPAWVSEGPVPEGVIFLRAAVAAGVLLGEVSDEAHARLDRWATWTALAWEARQGTLDRARWDGSLAALGERAVFPDEPVFVASEHVARALAPWGAHPTARALGGLFGALPAGPAAPREPDAWEPVSAPRPAPRTARAVEIEPASALDAFYAAHSESIERCLASMSEGVAPQTRGAIEYLHRQGGKRMRPLVVLASTRACGGDPRWALHDAALVEWLHQTSLVIDDVLDAATLRRGGVTLHHATSVPFATGVVLQILARLAVSARALPSEGRVLFAEVASTLADGEWSEMQRTGDPTLSATDYHRIIDAKTASLFGAAASLGGMAARAKSAEVRALGRAGRDAGLAFQLVDDLLDLVGDERDLGKRPGTDLRARKMTLPVILAREAAGPEARARLDAIVRGERPVDDEELAFVREQVRQSGADARCRERAHALLDRALAALERLPEREGRELLRAIFTRCVERDR